MSSVKVVAPSDLEEGYQFDATGEDGKSFKVTVPEGGVKEGEEFEVPKPEQPESSSDEDIVTGSFKNKLCDCTQVCCSGLWWMGWCCDPLLIAQLLTRMRLDWSGEPGNDAAVANTFGIIAIVFIVYIVIGWLPFLGLIFTIFIVFIGTKLRYDFRRRYKIEPSCCGDTCLDDCCCMYWCGCCASIQMARHTHDEKKYPYQCCSANGLKDSDPAVTV